MDSDRRLVTRWHRQLQGLQLLPLSALFLLTAVHDVGGFHLPGDGQRNGGVRWFIGGLAMVFAAAIPLRRWYKRYSQPRQRLIDSAAVPILLVAACLPVAVWLQRQAGLTVSLPALVVGAALAGVGIFHYRLRRHYLAAGAVLIGCAFLSPLAQTLPVRSALFDSAIGIVLAIVGIGDHVLLTTTLHDVTTLDDTTAPDDSPTLHEVTG